MKKIILGLSLLCFAIFGLQGEAFAHNGHHGHHSDYYVAHKKVKKYKRNHHPRYQKKVVYKTRYRRPRTQVVYAYPPARYSSYYEPLSFGFGYSNYSSGYHIQLGFD